MKAIIDKKMYNTETAEMIAEYDNGLGYGDFNYLYEALYRTKKGAFFLHGEGGANTIYNIRRGNASYGSSQIIPLSDDEAYQWLEDNDKVEEIERNFKNLIEEA